MTIRPDAIIDYLKDKQLTMIEQLHHLCAINSGTANLNGLRTMKETLHALFLPLADTITHQALEPYPIITMSGTLETQQLGDALYIKKRPHLKNRILLSGHMDTVYSVTHPFQKLKYIHDNHLNGPGVADMKGGLLVMLHALTAFETLDCSKNIGWDVLINADEEIGSPGSALLFKDIASSYQAALVYEPSMTDTGILAKNRKGSGKFTVIATGKAAHAGRSFNEGRNAIVYLAEALSLIHDLNNNREGVTINVGIIAGGEALNVVPDKAVAKLDIRINDTEDEHWIRTHFDAIVDTLKHSDYQLTIQGTFGRPVKRVNDATTRLFQRIQNIGEQLGIGIDWKDSGGCCDGNNLGSFGLPVIDTLGVRGGHIHSADEYVLLDSLSERAALSALLLCDLAQDGLEDLKQ